jgi:hypothetical protein
LIAIDTRARWIADMADLYARAENVVPTDSLARKQDPQIGLALFANLIGYSIGKIRRWLDASPDLRAAFVAKGWQP